MSALGPFLLQCVSEIVLSWRREGAGTCYRVFIRTDFSAANQAPFYSPVLAAPAKWVAPPAVPKINCVVMTFGAVCEAL